MRKEIFGALTLSLLVACEQQNFAESEETMNRLGVEAEVSSAGHDNSRTTTDGAGVSFTEGDKIGFYMPEAAQSGEWSLSSTGWTSTTAYVWPDKTSTFSFCAYYPFTNAVARTEIAMPVLANQTGDPGSIGDYDFLVARCDAGYSTANGVVSFTDESAFKHVQALLSITLKTGADTKGAQLSEIQLSAPGLMTASTYHFGEMADGDGVTLSPSAVDKLSLTGLNASILTSGVNYQFIVNPFTTNEDLGITVKYVREEDTFVASTKISTENLTQGSLNKLTISIKKSGLVVEGNTVENWTENTLEDITIEEGVPEK